MPWESRYARNVALGNKWGDFTNAIDGAPVDVNDDNADDDAPELDRDNDNDANCAVVDCVACVDGDDGIERDVPDGDALGLGAPG